MAKGFCIEHVTSKKDKTIQEEGLSLPERVDKICDVECNELLHYLRETSEMGEPTSQLR